MNDNGIWGGLSGLTEKAAEFDSDEPDDFPKTDEDKKKKRKKKRPLGRATTGYETKVDSMSGNYPKGMQMGSGALYTDHNPKGTLVEQARAMMMKGLQRREQAEKARKKAAKERIQARINALRGQKERMDVRAEALKRRKQNI